MRRGALVLLVACGCLSPGNPYYPQMDTKRPTLLKVDPPMGDLAGGDGGIPTLAGGQIITVTFSEPMDLDSLRPGIAVRDAMRQEQPLLVAVDPANQGPPTAADYDLPFPVHLASTSGFAPGVYQLILRELLIDQQGNTLEVTELDGGVSDNGFVATFQVQ